jgi:hypothetical protein
VPPHLLDQQRIDQLAHHVRKLVLVLRAITHFGLIRFHIDDLYVPLSRHQSMLRVAVLHGRLDIPDIATNRWNAADSAASP